MEVMETTHNARVLTFQCFAIESSSSCTTRLRLGGSATRRGVCALARLFLGTGLREDMRAVNLQSTPENPGRLTRSSFVCAEL
jgi:hypothetical protein